MNKLPKQRNFRKFNALDHLMMQVDTGLRTLVGKPNITERPNPENTVDEGDLQQLS